MTVPGSVFYELLYLYFENLYDVEYDVGKKLFGINTLIRSYWLTFQRLFIIFHKLVQNVCGYQRVI